MTPIAPVAIASDETAVIAETSSGEIAPPASVSVRHEPRNGAGIGLGRDIRPEGEQDAARQAVADAEHRGEHREPHRGARQVVRERRARGSPRPSGSSPAAPPTGARSGPSPARSRRTARSRSRPRCRRRARSSARRARSRRPTAAARPAARSGRPRGMPRPAPSRDSTRRNRHIVRKTPDSRSSVGIEPVTASPVSSAIDRVAARSAAAARNCRSGSGPSSTSSTVATRHAPKNQIAACSSPNSDEQSRRDERSDEHAEPEGAAEQRQRPRAERQRHARRHERVAGEAEGRGAEADEEDGCREHAERRREDHARSRRRATASRRSPS